MKCTVCGTNINDKDYTMLEMADVKIIYVMDETIESKTPYMNYKLCHRCADKVKNAVISELLNPESQCDGKCASCDLIR